MIRNLPPVMRTLLIAFIGAFLLLFLTKQYTLGIFPFVGRYAFEAGQFWRILTYPFLVGIFSLIGGAIVLIYFGSELETITGSRRLGLAIPALIVLGAVLLYLIAPDAIMAGPDVILLFIIAGFVYLWPTRELSLFGAFNIKAWIIGLIYYALDIIPMTGTRLDTSASKLFAPTYAVVAGLIFFHITYQQYPFGRSLLGRLSSIFSKSSSNKKPVSISTQDRIDILLDKISAKGMHSLSEEEKEFLRKNS